VAGTVENLFCYPKDLVPEQFFQVQVRGVSCHLEQYTIRVPPPETDKALASEEFLDDFSECKVENIA